MTLVMVVSHKLTPHALHGVEVNIGVNIFIAPGESCEDCGLDITLFQMFTYASSCTSLGYTDHTIS
jgi:hypothetical protein